MTSKLVTAPPTGVSVSRRAQRHRQKNARARNRAMGIVGACVLVVGIMFVVAQTTSDRGAPAAAPYAGSTLEIVLGDYSIGGSLTAPAGPVRLHAVNQGAIIHNVGVRGLPVSPDLRRGMDFTIDLGVLAPGTYQLYCDVPGHVALGMVADLVVTAPLPSKSATVTSP